MHFGQSHQFMGRLYCVENGCAILISQYKYKYGFNWKSLGCITRQMKSIGRICFILFARRRSSPERPGFARGSFAENAPLVSVPVSSSAGTRGRRSTPRALCRARQWLVTCACWTGGQDQRAPAEASLGLKAVEESSTLLKTFPLGPSPAELGTNDGPPGEQPGDSGSPSHHTLRSDF
uniref:Uncharacterized protein n=1 Tax=Molossus molossus TaxID=27622 RepID=A0A7J8E272_MOLMO|nr:hypothetical protein HJG59_008982 [Molossus molossus]